MFSIKLADHVLSIDNKYSYIEEMCSGYITSENPEKTISVTDEEILKEGKSVSISSKGYLETLAVYRKICEYLLPKDILLFHSSALEFEGKAYLFTAPSGTGKSTHSRLWRERFGEKVTMINDDKPLVSFVGGEARVYGTPYSGKEHLETNTSAPVCGIVVLHQASENTIKKLSYDEAYPLLAMQSYRPKNDPVLLIKALDLCGMLCKLPVYSLGCTISQEAVSLSFEALTGKNITDQ